MKPIRVLIVEMPQLMTDIAREIIARRPELVLVGVVADAYELSRALPASGADVVLCRMASTELPATYQEMFESHPHLRVLAVEPGDRDGSIYELRPSRTPLDVRPAGLAEALASTGGGSRRFSWDATTTTTER